MTRRSPGQPRKLRLDAREILRYHKRGMLLREIAAAAGVSRTTVTARLRADGIPPLKRGRKLGTVTVVPATS